MVSNAQSGVAFQMLEIFKRHPRFKSLIENVDPSTLDPDPWVSNFASISYSEDPKFCDKVSKLLKESKTPLFVALMRSVDDPKKIISPFHPVHVDSRKSDKTLMVLAGSGDYPVFAKIKWEDTNLLERLYIHCLHFVLHIIENLRLRPLQGKLSHFLSNGLHQKVYNGIIYYDDINDELIKFNNMLPHHSHPLPTRYSLLLQVVYN